MTVPKAALQFGPECFGSEWACEGPQVAAIASALEDLLGPLEWWVADVFPDAGFGASRTPASLGPTTSFVAWATNVRQFESGVFIATKPGATPSAVRNRVSSEDDPWLDMADALAEVRAFDTSYLDAVLADEATATALHVKFGGTWTPRS